MRQDLGVDVVDLMLARRISCFIAPERTFETSCGRGAIRTFDIEVCSHVL